VSVLVVLSLDHWHAGLAGFCGGEELLMPNVDRLAAESAVFDRHFSVAPSGDASVNGRAWADGGRAPRPVEISAAERFERAGVAAEVIADVESEWLTLAGWKSVRVVDEDLESCVGETVQQLEATGEEHRLLWVAVSGPAESDEGDWPENIERIDAALAGFDRCVAAAVDGLERAGLSAEALLVVTGGRGAWLGDRGFEDDGRPMLHEERLRTPLLLRGPGIEAGQRRLELVQVIDLLPTLLAWFDVRADDELLGINLLELLEHGGGGGHEEIVMRDADGGRGIRSHGLFLVRSGEGVDEVRLFNKPDDAWDLVDVSDQQLVDVERLSDRLDELTGSTDSSAEP